MANCNNHVQGQISSYIVSDRLRRFNIGYCNYLLVISTSENNRKWVRARVETMVNHLAACTLQEQDVLNQARLEKSSAGQKKSHQVMDIPGYGQSSPKGNRRFTPTVTGAPYSEGGPHSQQDLFANQARPYAQSSSAAGPSSSAFRIAPTQPQHMSSNPPSTQAQSYPVHNQSVTSSVIMSNEIRGRLALITGGTGGIGRATATLLAKAGCHVALHYHHAASKAKDIVQDLTASYGIRCHAFQADLSGGLRK